MAAGARIRAHRCRPLIGCLRLTACLQLTGCLRLIAAQRGMVNLWSSGWTAG